MLGKTEIDIIEEMRQYETVMRWLDGVAADHTGSEETERMYARCLKEFCKYVDKTPDQLMEGARIKLGPGQEIINETWREEFGETLKRFCRFLEKEKGLSRSTSNLYHGAIRSFTRYNKVPLKIKTPRTSKKRTPGLTYDEMKELDDAADERERWALRCLKDSGMSRKDAVELKYNDVKRDLEAGKDFIHLNVIRRKEQINYETFLGPNAVDALKTMLKVRRHRGEVITDETPLFMRLDGKGPLSAEALSLVISRLGKKIGIKASPHKVRKFFETYLALTVKHPIVLKYWMGHLLGSDIEAKYVIPPTPEQLKLYMEAYPKIDLVPKIDEYELWKAGVEARMSLMSPEEQKAFLDKLMKSRQLRIVRYAKRFKEVSEEEVTELRKKLRKAKTASNGGCANGHNCQRIVEEEELPGLLAEGWRVSAILPSGKVVVSSEY